MFIHKYGFPFRWIRMDKITKSQHVLLMESYIRDCPQLHMFAGLLLPRVTLVVARTLMIFIFRLLMSEHKQSRSHIWEHLGRVLKLEGFICKVYVPVYFKIMTFIDGSGHCYCFWAQFLGTWIRHPFVFNPIHSLKPCDSGDQFYANEFDNSRWNEKFLERYKSLNEILGFYNYFEISEKGLKK